MENNWTKIQAVYEAAQEDASKFFDKKNKAAGTRLRKAYKEISDLCKAGRKEVTEIKNS